MEIGLLFQLGGLFTDVEIILKVVGLLFIVSFVRSHVTNALLSSIIILALAAFLLFDFWKIFGGALFLYMVALFGFTHILVDLSFMHAFKSPVFNLWGLLSPKKKQQNGHDPRQVAEHALYREDD